MFAQIGLIMALITINAAVPGTLAGSSWLRELANWYKAGEGAV